jgi:Arc/MetJ-type ribon-helix-helix transcriptional regulator
MNQHAISISLSEDEQAFIEEGVATGRFADEREALHAGLASLELEAQLGALYPLVAEPDYVSHYVADNAPLLAEHLKSTESEGVSSRGIPDIMAAVKQKLRADGKL